MHTFSCQVLNETLSCHFHYFSLFYSSHLFDKLIKIVFITTNQTNAQNLSLPSPALGHRTSVLDLLRLICHTHLARPVQPSVPVLQLRRNLVEPLRHLGWGRQTQLHSVVCVLLWHLIFCHHLLVCLWTVSRNKNNVIFLFCSAKLNRFVQWS